MSDLTTPVLKYVDPGAGQDLVYAITSRCKLVSVSVQLTTSAAVANRTPVFELTTPNPGGHVFWTLLTPAAITANEGAVFNLAAGVPLSSITTVAAQPRFTLPIPEDLILDQGWLFEVSDDNLDPGDHYTMALLFLT